VYVEDEDLKSEDGRTRIGFSKWRQEGRAAMSQASENAT
jgi:hypothetical protein